MLRSENCLEAVQGAYRRRALTMAKRASFRLRRRSAIAPIIAGLIILTLIVTMLSTMVFISQQYDYYQQIATKMTQQDQQRELENLVANYPGLVQWTISSSYGWGAGCVTSYNCYNLTISNLGGVSVQIVAIYITSVGGGCTSLCVLKPSSSSTSYIFLGSTQFLNEGETNHIVLLYLPLGSKGNLPSGTGQNTITIVTSRGNEFSFQWPLQIQILGGQTTAAFSAGIMKVAYQCVTCGIGTGYDSENEPGVPGGSGSPATGYCHYESTSNAESANEIPQEFTGITVGGQPIPDSGNLWFVNPWLTQEIFCTTAPGGKASSNCSSCSGCTNQTTLYLYVNITNTGATGYTPAGGSLDLTWYGSNHIDGTLIGMWYENNQSLTWQFYPIGASNAPMVYCATYSQCESSRPASNPDFFYGIFRVTAVTLGSSSSTWPPQVVSASAYPLGVTFWGSLSLSNNLENTQFVGGTELSTGLWVRTSC